MACCQSYLPDYFSVIDILSTEERITCKVEIEVQGLGFLDNCSPSYSLKIGTKVVFPLWLAEALKNLQNSIVSVDIPTIYKEGYRQILEADADVIKLSKWSPYFYELGMHVIKFGDKETEQIYESLLQAYKTRFRLVMDWAQNPSNDASREHQLPRLERDIYLNGKKAKILLLEWLTMGTNSILPSEITANFYKRKRGDYF